MKFEDYGIAGNIKKSIKKLGYKRPTDIQYKSIPPILRGEDVLAIAQTGTGKTAAFAIPIIEIIQAKKIPGRPDGVKCLVMAPTHELALQIDNVFKSIAEFTSLTSYCIHGGVDQDPQKAQLNKGVDVLIATPGRMFDLVSQGDLKLTRVEILVLDEADHMLDLGFIKDIRDLMYHLPRKRQTLFFSATIDEKIKKLAYSLVKNAIRIQISPKNPVAKNIDHSVAHIQMDDKRFFLEEMIKTHSDKKILVFVRTKVRAERVKKAMARVNLEVDTIHSDKEQSERKETMDNFRNGSLKVLVATDISARGSDIPNVEFVINYDMPESSEYYVHRVGRTGRASHKGQAYSFCSKEEKDLLQMIEEDLDKPIKKLKIDTEAYQYTLDTSEDTSQGWQALMKEAELSPKEYKQKEKKKNKNKKKRRF